MDKKNSVRKTQVHRQIAALNRDWDSMDDSKVMVLNNLLEKFINAKQNLSCDKSRQTSIKIDISELEIDISIDHIILACLKIQRDIFERGGAIDTIYEMDSMKIFGRLLEKLEEG